jgi:two-component system cell cycle sensor histidine kinase/response regulator CckA
MDNADFYAPEISYLIAMRENRLRGERTVAIVRIVLALSAAAVFVICKVSSGTFYRTALQLLFLAVMSLALLYSFGVIYLLKVRGYRRFLSFVSSSIDISAISFMVIVTLTYAGNPSAALAAFTLVYAVYFPVILLSLRRHDPQNGLFTGLLACLEYLIVVLAFRYSPVYLLRYGSGTAAWLQDVAPSELFKSLLLLLAGVFSFTLSRNLIRRLRSASRTEGALRVEEAYLTQFFESTPEAIVLSDSQTRILRINNAFTKLFGYTKEEALGRSIDELVVPKNLKAEGVGLSQTAQGGADFLTETVRRRKDNSLVDVSILGAPIFYREQQVAIFGIYRDVTERKKKERLYEAINRIALAMQGALTHRQVIDAVALEFEHLGYRWSILLLEKGRDVLRVEHLSFETELIKAVERLWGLEARDVRVPIDCAEEVSAVIEKGETRFVEDSTELVRAMVPEGIKNLAGRLVRTLGVTRTIGAPLMEEGRVIGLFGVHSKALTPQDVPAITAFANQLSAAWQKISLIGKLEKNIGELQQTQAQLIQAQKMEAVGRLAGGIAHDFNNLLTVIRGYSELLLSEYDLVSSVRETVEEIRKAGEQASQLTGHLLAFSRKQMFRPRIVNINDTIRGMEKILQRLIGEDVELETSLEPDLASIRIDPHRIQQVIMNLAVNARDAMPEGGRLRLETANTCLGPDFVSWHPEVEAGSYALLAITDTGSGIAEDILPQIFEPFFTTKDRGRGTGLGLSTVYGIVKQSLGYIYAENVPHGGARFTLYFPTSEGEALSVSEADEAPQDLAGTEKILLVEDQETVRHLTESILQRSGYRVVCASDAEKALNLTPEVLKEIHVLITDVVMPGMNGRALARKLKGDFPDLKVLFLSGYAAEVTGAELDGDQLGELLQKPFSRIDLLRRLRRLIDG